MKSICPVGDTSDAIQLYQLRPNTFVIADEDGHLNEIADNQTSEYFQSADESRITFIYTYNDQIIISTEQSIYMQQNKSLLDPLSPLEKLDPLEMQTLLQFNKDAHVTYMTLSNSNLLLGYSDGRVTELNMETKQEEAIARMEDAIVNLQVYKGQVLLINDMSGRYAVHLLGKQQLLCNGNGSTHARGFRTFQKLPPAALLVNGYVLYSNGQSVLGRLPDSPQAAQFTLEVANCQAINEVIGNYVLLVTDQAFILGQLGVELRIVEKIEFDRGLYEILQVQTHINNNEQVELILLYNDNDQHYKHVGTCTFKSMIKQQKNDIPDTRYTTEQLIREVNTIAANKKNQQESISENSEQVKNKQKSGTQVRYLDEINDDEIVMSDKSRSEHTQSENESSESDDRLDNILKMLEEMRHQQLRPTGTQAVHQIKPTQLSSNQTRETAKRLLRICRHGHVTLSKGQSFSLAFHFSDDRFQDKILHSKSEIITCDIQDDAICYVSEFEVQVQEKKPQGRSWYASFSPVLKPVLVALGDSNYCTVAFESGVVIVYAGGVTVSQLFFPNLAGISACNSTLLIVTTTNFQIIDVSALKIIYSGSFSPIGQLLFAEIIQNGLCCIQDEKFIYLLNYQSGIDGINAVFVPVHSPAEENVQRMKRVHEIVKKVLRLQSDNKGSGDQNAHQKLLRSDLEQLIPSFSQIIYLDTDETGMPLVYAFPVPQKAARFTQGHQFLDLLVRGRQSKEKRQIEQLFAQDIAAVLNRFPEQFRVEIPVIGLPDVVQCVLSPPINALSQGNELEPLERQLYLQGIILNTRLIYDMSDDQKVQIAQLRYDVHVLAFSRECLIRGDEARLLTAVRLFRSRKMLEEFQELVTATKNYQLVDSVVAILQDNFQDDVQFQADGGIQKSLELLADGTSGSGLYVVRQDAAFAQFGQNDNPGSLNQAKAQLRAEMNDQITAVEARILQSMQKTKPKVQTSPIVVKKQEEENLAEPSPDGNKNFLEMLRKKAPGKEVKEVKEPQTPQKPTLKLASSTTSPKKSGLNLSSVISK